MTLAFMPDRLPNELLFGWLARHRVLIGGPVAAAHTALLFGTRSAVASPCLQGRLGDLAHRIGVDGLNADQLLSDYTLFPYYTAFQDPRTTANARNALIETGGASVFVRLGLAAFSMGPRAGHLYVCSECHAKQVATAGMPTWLRSHQLPGNLVCDRHGRALFPSPLSDRGRHEFSLPPTSIPTPPEQAWSAGQRDVLIDIARRQAALLDSDTKGRPLEEWKPHYRELLASRGLMRSAAKVDHPRLAAAVDLSIGPVLALLPPPCRVVGNGGWPSLLVREHRKAMHPLFHTLMAIVVESTEAPRVRKRLTVSPPRRRPVAATRPSRTAAKRIDWSEVERVSQVRIRHAHRLLLAAVPLCRITFSLIERTAFSNGWLRKRGHALPRSFALAENLAEDASAFLDRRLVHWGLAMPDAPVWQVCRAAGVRHQHWPEAAARLAAMADGSRLAA